MRIAEHFHGSLNEIPTETIYQALQDRERTQNTALGQGLALPHASINNLSHNPSASSPPQSHCLWRN